MTWQIRTAEDPLTPIIIKRLVESGYLVDDVHTSVIVHNLERLQTRLNAVSKLFPQSALHTLAVKANPLPGILKCAVDQGWGLETASSGELALARSVGCPPERIVFDSPAKTRRELLGVSGEGITVNVNSGSELERVAKLNLSGPVGLRINPMVAESDRESATMVATARSKFGVPLNLARPLLDRFQQVTGLHVHVGSQVATKADLVEAARRVVELATQYPSITWLDIGGGLPTRYRTGDPGLHPAEYLRSLLEAAPKLANYRLITEMGRAIQANCGFAVSRVEYVTEDRMILHLGADFALRECYQNDSWYHEIEVFDSQGRLKTGETRPYDLFGPLCFSGDRLASQRSLPEVEEGDLLVMHDTGGYTLGMWSRYCSRLMPEVLAWDGSQLEVLRKRETEDDLVRFWG